MKKARFLLSLLMLGALTGCGQSFDGPGTEINANSSVSSVLLSSNENTIEVESSFTLTATVSPENATNKNVTWESNNLNVATVSNGVVTGVSAGSAIITVRTVDGDKTATCTVTVVEKGQNVSVSSVLLSSNENTIEVESSFTLTATVSPENATNKNVTWESNNLNVATVSNGVVTGVSAGSAIITVKTADGNKVATCNITVTEKAPLVVPVTAISINTKTLEMTEGDVSEQLTYIVLPTNASNQNVTWYSTDPEVATVSNGVVTALKKGTANIVVKTEDGEKKDFCSVTVAKLKNNINGYLTDTNNLLKENPLVEIDGDYVSTELTTDGDENYYIFKYGANVKLKLAFSGDIIPTGVTVNEKMYYVDDNYEVVFKAECDDEDNFFLDMKVEYKYTTKGDYTFSVSGNEELDVTFKNSNFDPITSANANDRVYVSCSGKEGYESYVCIGVTIKYQSSDYGNYTSMEANYDETSGMYYFSIPSSRYNKELTIIVNSKDSKILEGTTLPGKYVCLWLTNATHKISSNDLQSQMLNITQTGTISYATNEATSFEDEITDVNKDDMTFRVAKNYDDILYGEDYVFTSTNKSNEFAEPCHNYDLICYKMESTTDKLENYSVRGEKFKIDDHDYVIATFFKDNTPLSSVFIDYSNLNSSSVKINTYYDVDIDMLYGENPWDDQVMYVVSKNGEKITMFTSELDGGYQNRLVCTGNEGIYTCGQDELVVYNSNCAFINGEKCKITFDGNNAELAFETKTININVNFDEMTFAKISETEEGLSVPAFNCTFTGRHNDNDGYYYDWSFEVLNDNGTITGTLTQSPGSYTKQEFYFTGEYDTATNILTVNIYNKSYYSSYKKTIHAYCEDGKVTFKDNIDREWYYTEGMVLTCNTFTL